MSIKSYYERKSSALQATHISARFIPLTKTNERYPSIQAMALDRYSSDKSQRKAPETNPDLINFLSDRFDWSYFDLIFATAMESEGYTTGQGLCHDYEVKLSLESASFGIA